MDPSGAIDEREAHPKLHPNPHPDPTPNPDSYPLLTLLLIPKPDPNLSPDADVDPGPAGAIVEIDTKRGVRVWERGSSAEGVSRRATLHHEPCVPRGAREERHACPSRAA